MMLNLKNLAKNRKYSFLILNTKYVYISFFFNSFRRNIHPKLTNKYISHCLYEAEDGNT